MVEYIHQMPLEIMYQLEAFQLPYSLDNDAKSMVKHLKFPQIFAIIRT